MARRRTPSYLATPDRAELPLSLDEIRAVAADGGASLRPAAALAHFLTRTEITAQAYIGQLQQLHAQLELASAQSRSRTGVATTMNPLDAVRYLNDDQRRELFQGLQRDAYDAARAEREAAAEAAATARRRLAASKLVLTRLAEDPTLDEAARARIVAALAEVDALAATEAEPAKDAHHHTAAPAPSAASDDVEHLGDLFS